MQCLIRNIRDIGLRCIDRGYLEQHGLGASAAVPAIPAPAATPAIFPMTVSPCPLLCDVHVFPAAKCLSLVVGLEGVRTTVEGAGPWIHGEKHNALRRTRQGRFSFRLWK
jgi:hypothetical protein